MEAAIESLGRQIARWTEQRERHETAVPGLALFRREQPTEPVSGMYEPSICLIAQGAKRMFLGEDTYVYDAHHYLITSVHRDLADCGEREIRRISERAWRGRERCGRSDSRGTRVRCSTDDREDDLEVLRD